MVQQRGAFFKVALYLWLREFCFALGDFCNYKIGFNKGEGDGIAILDNTLIPN